MEIRTAVALIEKAFPTKQEEVWADLGAGGGLFTNALAELLQNGSIVYAVDKDRSALHSISLPDPDIQLRKVVLDFSEITAFDHELLDGILMANSIHYIKDKIPFLQTLIATVKKNGKLLFVEYDNDKSNTWIPYPLSFASLQKLTAKLNLHPPIKLGETPSRYGQGNIYAALISL